MNVSAGGHAQAALEAGGEVGDDVAEHIVSHDDIEGPRIAHHLHTQRVYVHVLGGNLRMFATHFLEHALPQASGVGHGIRLVAHEHAPARRAIEFWVLLAVFEGVADDAFDAFARVDVFLDRYLVRRALLEDSACVGVDAFRVLADHNEVHILWLDALQRTQRAIEQPHRTHVGVEVHLEAHAQQNFFGVDVGFDAGIAEGAGKNRVKVALQHGEALGRHGHAVAEIAVGAPVEFAHLDIGARCPDHFESLRNYFLANPIPGNDSDTFFLRRVLRVHGRNLTQGNANE